MSMNTYIGYPMRDDEYNEILAEVTSWAPPREESYMEINPARKKIHIWGPIRKSQDNILYKMQKNIEELKKLLIIEWLEKCCIFSHRVIKYINF